MSVGNRWEINRLCYAKLYEFELISRAEEKISERCEGMASTLSECALKALRDYRALLRFSRRRICVNDVRLRSERICDIIGEIVKAKESWISSAQSYAFEIAGREKELLTRICESEAEEIHKLRRCLS